MADLEQDKLVEAELWLVERAFNRSKSIVPTVILIKDARRFQIPASSSNAAAKDIVSQGIKDLVKSVQPDMVIFSAEAWMSIIRETPFDLGSRGKFPIQRRQHQEIVVVQIEFKTGQKYSRMARILRNGAEARLDSFEPLGEDLTSGRFMDFYPQIKN